MPGMHKATRIVSRLRWVCDACLRWQQKPSQPLSFSSSIASPLPVASSRSTLRQKSRGFHTSRELHDTPEQNRQAVPLGDFYTELLSTPLTRKAQADNDLPDFVHLKDESKLERARKLFGSIEGSGYERRTADTPDSTWQTVNGVPIPPRPLEPDNCCMSGCVHCVWDDYRDDVESWAARLAEAQAKSPQRRSRGGTPKIDMPRWEVSAASGSMDDDGGGSESLWQTPSSGADVGDELFQGIPVGIREFMATEKRIRERKKSRKEKVNAGDDEYP
jgi:hypothetical protein